MGWDRNSIEGDKFFERIHGYFYCVEYGGAAYKK
jgi:hypothetical protein